MPPVPPITDAVIPVSGLGTRLLPATRSQPKEMLPVIDKPVVQYVVEELAAAGITRVLFVTGRRKRAIEDHFDADPELEDVAVPGDGVQFLYTRQPRPAGLGDALARARGFAGDGGTVVALGDAIVSGSVVSRLIAAYEAGGIAAVVAVEEVPEQDVSRYGVVVTDETGAVTDVVEKPDPAAVDSRLVIAARYVLGPAVFATLAATPPDSSGEVQVADALRTVIAAGGRVVAVPLEAGERRHDIGTVQSYCEAFLEHALKDPRHGPALRARARALIDASR
jgi:UTP--glucose-1-phosphate uridylyltransferase